MNLLEQGSIVHYHQNRQENFGHGVESLGWTNINSQQVRFDVIRELIDFHDCSLLDAGCGKGDLFYYLISHQLSVRYIGVDLNPAFIKQARRQFQKYHNTRFYQADFSEIELPMVDHVVACGALNYRIKDPVYWKKSIARLFSSARRSLVFNFLNNKTFPEHPLLTGHRVEEVIDFCQSICRQLDIRTGYIKHDTTLCLHW